MNEWEKVENYVADRFPSESLRGTKESLKRKFSTLYRTRIKTGDPNCPPPDVKRAKRLLIEIKNRCDLTEGEDDDDDDESGEDDESAVDGTEEQGVAGPDEQIAVQNNRLFSDGDSDSFQSADDDLPHNRSEASGESEQVQSGEAYGGEEKCVVGEGVSYSSD